MPGGESTPGGINRAQTQANSAKTSASAQMIVWSDWSLGKMTGIQMNMHHQAQTWNKLM
jgi:hypothetical protein